MDVKKFVLIVPVIFHLKTVLVILHLKVVRCELLISPVNTTTRVCEVAAFTCAGSGVLLSWVVNGEASSHPDNAERGLVIDETVVELNISSILGVPASAENDGLLIVCTIIESFIPVTGTTSPVVYLSVEGPGQVDDFGESNLTLSSVCIQWKQPYMCHNGLNSFSYSVSVKAINFNDTTVVTTNETDYCFPIDPCLSYVVTVLPIVQMYNGLLTSLTVKGPGDYYTIIQFETTNIIFESEDFCNVTFWIQVNAGPAPCPNQSLLVTIDNGTVYSMPITNSNFSFISEGLGTEEQLTATARIVDTNTNTFLSENRTNISTFSLQSVSSEVIEIAGGQKYLSVQCEFAQRSSAMGCFVALDIYGSLSVNYTILRKEGSDFAIENISVPAAGGGVIQLTVYNIDKSGNVVQDVLPVTLLIPVSSNIISVMSQLVPTPSSSANAISPSMMPPLAPMMTNGVLLIVSIGVTVVAVVIVGVIAGVTIIAVCVLYFHVKKKDRKDGEESTFSRYRYTSTSYTSEEAKGDSTDTDPLLPDAGESELPPPGTLHQPPPSEPPPQPPSAKQDPMYDVAYKFPQRAKETHSSPASKVVGISYSELQHIDKPVPSIFMVEDVHYTKLKGEITYENVKDVGISSDLPPPLPAKTHKHHTLVEDDDRQDFVGTPATDANQSLSHPAAESPALGSAASSLGNIPIQAEKSEGEPPKYVSGLQPPQASSARYSVGQSYEGSAVKTGYSYTSPEHEEISDSHHQERKEMVLPQGLHIRPHAKSVPVAAFQPSTKSFTTQDSGVSSTGVDPSSDRQYRSTCVAGDTKVQVPVPGTDEQHSSENSWDKWWRNIAREYNTRRDQTY